MPAVLYIAIFVMYICFKIVWELTELLIKLTVFAVCGLFGRRVWLHL